MAIEIVDLPIKNSGSFHSYVAVYQRVKEEILAPNKNFLVDAVTLPKLLWQNQTPPCHPLPSHVIPNSPYASFIQNIDPLMPSCILA